MKLNKTFLSILFFCCTINSWAQKNIVINNSKPRLTVDNKIVDAHDGRIIQFGNKFYWYGTAYGNTNGFTKVNQYVCYSSADLTNWQFENKLLMNEPEGVYYRPHVVYNSKTKKYVLWYNWYPKLWNGQFGVATSDKPTGPFAIVNNNVTVKQNALGVGDLGVFVDDDAKAYLSYNTIQGHKVSVELLDESYTGSTLQGSEFIAEHCEAGSMFKRNGLYYLLTDYTCCFCTQGSGAKVFTASSPLGPFNYRQNINRYPGMLISNLKDGVNNDTWFENFTAKEKNAVQLWMNKATSISSLTISQFTGNRNGQCGEVDNPVLHQPIIEYKFKVEYFTNGEWKEMNVANPAIQKLAITNQYTYKFKQVLAERLRITPLYADSLSNLQIAEIATNVAATNFTVYKTAGENDGKPIIPSQQTYVMEVNTTAGKQYIWMGDLWGSASDGIKGHDYQFWSRPLQFYNNGLIGQLQWADNFTLSLK